MSIIKAIDNAFINMKLKNWDKIFYFFDLHETVLYPDYGEDIPNKMYPNAKEVLQYLTKRKDISMSIFTCSYPKEIKEYIEYFKTMDIEFDFVNKNPDVDNTTYGFYEDKPYFNVLFEDKAGFDGEKDWTRIKKHFRL